MHNLQPPNIVDLPEFEDAFATRRLEATTTFWEAAKNKRVFLLLKDEYSKERLAPGRDSTAAFGIEADRRNELASAIRRAFGGMYWRGGRASWPSRREPDRAAGVKRQGTRPKRALYVEEHVVV